MIPEQIDEFSDGQRTNNFLKKRGVEIMAKHQKSYSWEIEDEDTAVKVLDKSAFKHSGTGIPREIKWFFVENDQKPGKGPEITLVHENSIYTAFFEYRDYGSKRVRLFWNAEFSALLQHAFPYHFQQYQYNKEPASKVVLRFKRLEGYSCYEVTLAGEVAEVMVAEDIEAELLEEQGPRVEGRVKQYFGKRYERDPVNRRKAIEYHGLACNACGFNFEEVYGERGGGYIEVHHVKPISTLEQEQLVNPKTDLVTLCSNCHRMVHRKQGDILTIAQLIEMIN